MFSPWRRVALYRRVLVNLKTGNAVRGVLVEQAGGLLMLKASEYLEVGREPVPVDGEVLVELGNVDFVQVLPGQGG